MKTFDYLHSYFRPLTILFLTLGFSGKCLIAQSSHEKDSDKTLSPYFFVLSEGLTEQLPLKSTSANVAVAGTIANVKVTQIYKNEGKDALEAIYVFPASTRASVYDMKMTIGDRIIKAVISEREQARKDYERAKQEGKSASLLEQQRPNVFQMNVANIMPGDEIKVELFYSELIVPEKGVYEFVYPAVVGPRYSNKHEEDATLRDKWVANPYTEEGEKAMYTFDLKVNLNGGMPVRDIICNTHETDITYKSPSVAVINLKKGNEFEGNRDFILKYRLKGDQIQTGVMLYEGKDENFFLAMVQPPKSIKLEQVPPREYVFIIDVSGSMNGFPIDISKKLMQNLLKNLRPTDKFNVILFAGVSSLLNETSLAVNDDNIRKAMRLIDDQEGGGATELIPALQKALALKGSDGYARTFVIATDGYVDVEKETFDLIRKNLGNASFFAFGIGSAVNRFAIEGMARAGSGEPFIVEMPGKADAMAEAFREYIQTPVLTNVKVSFEGFNVYDAEPLTIPSLYAERPLYIFGKYKGRAAGKISISGTTGGGNFTKSIDVSSVNPLVENKVLMYLWARNRIMMLDDYGKVPGDFESTKNDLINLGLKYNLLTAYTSFVAIDSEVRNNTGKISSVKQPLPLPQGVNNNAIGYSGSGNNISRKSKAVKGTSLNKEVVMDKSVTLENLEERDTSEEKTSAVSEEAATFQGGDLSLFSKWVQSHLKYPQEHAGSSLSGKIYAQFTVNEFGRVVDVKIVRGLDPLVDKEVERVLKSSPAWKPAKKQGKTVKQTFTIPVIINLELKRD